MIWRFRKLHGVVITSLKSSKSKGQIQNQ